MWEIRGVLSFAGVFPARPAQSRVWKGRVGVDVRVGDILEMKKQHPCGEKRFLVLRSGMDFRIRCTGCGREVLVPRAKVEKNIKKIIREEPGA